MTGRKIRFEERGRLVGWVLIFCSGCMGSVAGIYEDERWDEWQGEVVFWRMVWGTSEKREIGICFGCGNTGY